MTKNEIFEIISHAVKEINPAEKITLFSSLKDKFDDLDIILIKLYIEDYFKRDINIDINNINDLVEYIYKG